MQHALAEKTAVITGAGRGIGRAIAQGLALEGADILIADLDRANAERAAGEIRETGVDAMAYPVDLSDTQAIEPMILAAEKRWGHLDILVNNAGISQTRALLDITESEWDAIMSINLRGAFFCLQAAARLMIRRVPEEIKRRGRSETSHGKIVNLSSISGRRGRPVSATYAAGKAAIISVTQSAALALAPYGINVNAVSPSVVPTPMWETIDAEKGRLFGLPKGRAIQDFVAQIPLKRAGRPAEIASAVVFLCSSGADYITGQTLNVDGGYEMD